jgi:hypothetical protein
MSKKSWIIIIAEALLFVFILGTMTHCSNDRISTLETNMSAYRDSIEYVNMRNGELLASRQSFIMSEAQAREELEISKKEIGELKKQLNSDIAYIAKLEAELELKDTLWMRPDTVFINSDTGTQLKHFIWNNKWTEIKSTIIGNSILDASMTINKLHMNVPLQLGLTDDYKLWVKSENPFITFTDIDGVVIDGSSIKPIKRKWNFGLHAGVGVHYGLFGQQVDVGPYVGFGISYNF